MTITVGEMIKNIGEDTVVLIKQEHEIPIIDITVTNLYDKESGTVSIPIESLEKFTTFLSNLNKMIEEENEE